MKNKSLCMQISFLLLAGGLAAGPMAGCGLLPEATPYVVEGESMGEKAGDLDKIQDPGEGEQSPDTQREDNDLTAETPKDPLGDHTDQAIPDGPQEDMPVPAPGTTDPPTEIPITPPDTDAAVTPDVIATPIPIPTPGVQPDLTPGAIPTPTPDSRPDPTSAPTHVSVPESSVTPTPVPEAIVKPNPSAGEDGGVSVDEDGTVYLPEIPFS